MPPGRARTRAAAGRREAPGDKDIKELTEVGRRLHAEHEATLSILNALESAFLSRPAGEPMDLADADGRQRLERLIRVVKQDVSRHFDFEEECIFPILREMGARDMANLLTHEHAAIKPLARRLEALADAALTDGFTAATWGEFRVQVIELMEREAFHIQKEEMGMVRALGYFLDPERDRELARRYDES